jgi:thioredoxin 1
MEPTMPVDSEPTRDEIDQSTGPVVLEFGASWCGHCRALQPRLADLLAQYPEVRHIKVEDGPGKPLGRSFRVKLWPTLIFLRDGAARGQAVRLEDAEVRQGLEAITGRQTLSDQPSPGSASP